MDVETRTSITTAVVVTLASVDHAYTSDLHCAAAYSLHPTANPYDTLDGFDLDTVLRFLIQVGTIAYRRVNRCTAYTLVR